MTLSGDWSAQQLPEFLAAVSAYADEKSALQGAVELAAEALEAEIGAIVRRGKLVASVGFRRDQAPEMDLIEAAAGRKASLLVDGLGECQVLVAPLDDSQPGHILLGRYGELGFDRTEANLLRAMGRILVLTIKMLRLTAKERRLRGVSDRRAEDNADLLLQVRQRQTLLERLGYIRASISAGAPLDRVQEAIVDGAVDLLGDEVVGLRLVDPDDPAVSILVAFRGIRAEMVESLRRSPVELGVGGQAITEGRLVVVRDYRCAPDMIPAFADNQLQTAMAAPLRDGTRIVGSLTVASYRADRRYTDRDNEALVALSELANIAITDARHSASIQHQAFHDALTGLANRALFMDRLDRGLARARQKAGAHVGLLFLDLDGFKAINDSLGHAGGDEVLQRFGETLKKCLRETDTAARLGGDEFAVLIEDMATNDEAILVARRIAHELSDPRAVSKDGIEVTSSIGIAVAEGGTDDAQSLLRNADLAMYQAKRAGGSERWAIFEPDMYTALVNRRDLEADLIRAVARQEFVVQYQPIIRLDTGRLSGVEALVRWMHPTRGLVPPVDFITSAEETGLIVPIGGWVLQTAVKQACAWHHRYPDEVITMSVNLSPRQMREDNVVEEVLRALSEAGLPPSLLVLEITESMFMRETGSTIDKLRRLRDAGVRLAIDDFGTGYSSLGYLQRFSVDVLKIDRSFVDGIDKNLDRSALAHTIINIGQDLNLKTVAEGIETREELDHLRALDCQYGQGYYFARPMNLNDMGRFIRRGIKASTSHRPGHLLPAIRR